MSWFRFLRRARWDDERAAELQDYLAHETADNIARGMTPDDAACEAHRKLGNVRQSAKRFQMNTLHVFETDLAGSWYGLRLLRRNPSSRLSRSSRWRSAPVPTGIFQLVNSVRLRPLPVDKPHELVWVNIDTHRPRGVGWRMSRRGNMSQALWEALRREQQAFSQAFAFGITTWNLGRGARPALLTAFTSAATSSARLGVGAETGRVLSEIDDRQGCDSAGAV